MATTDPKHNPSGDPKVLALKTQAAELAGLIIIHCPDNHVRQLAMDNLRVATMLAVQSFFETGD